MPRGLVGKGSSHRLTLQGNGGDAGSREMARVCAGCQGGHLSPPSPGRTQPGALDGQVWRPWRGPGREHGGQWGTTSRSCGQCGLGPWHQVADKQVPVLQSQLGKSGERRGGGPSAAEPCCLASAKPSCPAGSTEPCGRDRSPTHSPAPNRPRPCWARAWRWGNCAPHARPVLWPAGWSVLLLSAWPSRLPPRPLADLSWSPHVSPALPGPPGLDPPLQRQTWRGLVSAGAGSMT